VHEQHSVGEHRKQEVPAQLIEAVVFVGILDHLHTRNNTQQVGELIILVPIVTDRQFRAAHGGCGSRRRPGSPVHMHSITQVVLVRPGSQHPKTIREEIGILETVVNQATKTQGTPELKRDSGSTSAAQ
jgi:hypothetical protein